MIEKFPTYDKSITDKVYKEIVQNQELPEECDILISTSRLKEGIDILNDEVCVICDNHILSNLIQFLVVYELGMELYTLLKMLNRTKLNVIRFYMITQKKKK